MRDTATAKGRSAPLRACAVLPVLLVLAGAGLETARALSAPEPDVVVLTPRSLTAPDRDLALIDSVLAWRAPWLDGATRDALSVAVGEEARRAGFDPMLVLAVIEVESDFEADAISPRGARGLMQVRPKTLAFVAQRAGWKLSRAELEKDPVLSVRLGVRYLKTLHDRFGDLDLALMAYNAGPARVLRGLRARDLSAWRPYARKVRQEFIRFRDGRGWSEEGLLARREVLVP